MEKVSVVGARGFIGSHLVRELESRGRDVRVIARGERPEGALGTLVYCAGVTADFRVFPYRAVRAHAVDLMPLLEEGQFDRLVYLSSARVYGLAPAPTNEGAPLAVRPADTDHLYNASKIMGESLIAASGRPAYVLRLSNVVGLDAAGGSFLAQVAKEAVTTGRVLLKTALSSEKDYVAIADVVRAMVAAIDAKIERGTYNVASGSNTTHGEIVEELARLTSARVEVADGAPRVVYPRMDVERLRGQMEWTPASVLSLLPALVAAFRGAVA